MSDESEFLARVRRFNIQIARSIQAQARLGAAGMNSAHSMGSLHHQVIQTYQSRALPDPDLTHWVDPVDVRNGREIAWCGEDVTDLPDLIGDTEIPCPVCVAMGELNGWL